MRRGQLLILVAALVGSACNFPGAWGDEELRAKMAHLKPNELDGVTLDLGNCGTGTGSLGPATSAQLITRLGALIEAPDVGKREPWKDRRVVRIRTTRGESFKITIATRESLRGRLVVSLAEEPAGGLGFYEGEAFWEWLKRTPELEDPTGAPTFPCDPAGNSTAVP